jgi:hypothetical protein
MTQTGLTPGRQQNAKDFFFGGDFFIELAIAMSDDSTQRLRLRRLLADIEQRFGPAGRGGALRGSGNRICRLK